MARPLQKKKNKSSLPRVRQKPKSKRVNIKGNPIVAANWYFPSPLFRSSLFLPQHAQLLVPVLTTVTTQGPIPHPLPKLPAPRPQLKTKRPHRRHGSQGCTARGGEEGQWISYPLLPDAEDVGNRRSEGCAGSEDWCDCQCGTRCISATSGAESVE